MKHLKSIISVILISQLTLFSGFAQTSPKLLSEGDILTTGGTKILSFFDRPDGNYSAVSEHGFMVVSLSKPHIVKELSFENYFEKGSGKYSSFECKKVIPTSDGGYFIAGKGYQESESKIFGLKTDSEGQFLWISEPEEYIYDFDFISEDEAGNFYMAGNDGEIEISIYLIKLNSKGTKVWAKETQSIADNTVFWHTAVRPDDSFILTGFKKVGEDKTLVVSAMDTDGKILWDKDLGAKLQDDDYSYYKGGCYYNIILESSSFSDNSFYTKVKAGKEDIFIFSDENGDFLFKINNEDIFSKSGISNYEGKRMGIAQIIKLDKKHLATVSVCETDRENKPFNISFIADKNGNITWHKVFEESEWFYDMTELKDGGVLLNICVKSDTEILKFDKKGSLVWEMNYGDKSWQSDTPMLYKNQTDGKSILVVENDFDAVNYVYKLIKIQE